MINIEIWASGRGSNANNIVHHFKDHESYRVSALSSNKLSSGIFDIGAKNEIPTFHLTKEIWEGGGLLATLKQRKTNVIILAGFLKLVPQSILSEFEGRMVNVHPSLLPDYGGKGMYGMHVHQSVYDHQETNSGITIHEVSQEFDKGKLLSQFSCDITSCTSPEDIAHKIHGLEAKYFPKTIEHWLKTIW